MPLSDSWIIVIVLGGVIFVFVIMAFILWVVYIRKQLKMSDQVQFTLVHPGHHHITYRPTTTTDWTLMRNATPITNSTRPSTANVSSIPSLTTYAPDDSSSLSTFYDPVIDTTFTPITSDFSSPYLL